MTRLRTIITALIAMIVVAGCGKKVEVAEIAEWDTYQDPYYRISFSHPKGWVANAEGGIVKVYSSQAAAEKFFDPYSSKPDGVELTVGRERMDTLKTIEAYVEAFKQEKSAQGFLVNEVKAMQLQDLEGMMINFAGRYTKENKVTTTRVIAMKDSFMYFAQYSAFNEMYEPYKVAWDSLMATLHLPKPKTTEPGVDPSIPSEEFDTFDNFALRISYPSNFDAATPKPKGEAKFSLELKGLRQDCIIRVDILPAKGLNVDKVFEQNEKFYKVISKGQSTIDGQKTLFLNYSPAKNISSRAYFFVKDDKVIRTIVNFYAPMRTAFLPVFERSVASLKVK